MGKEFAWEFFDYIYIFYNGNSNIFSSSSLQSLGSFTPFSPNGCAVLRAQGPPKLEAKLCRRCYCLLSPGMFARKGRVLFRVKGERTLVGFKY